MRSPELIVGVDGSSQSEQALIWAANEAALRQSDLLVLSTYEFGTATPMGAPFAAEARRHAEELVADAVATVRKLTPEVTVRGEAVLGDAGHTLVRASGDGATIVVGNRGRGGFASLLLGSVSRKVALHAHGPVVVVRGRPSHRHAPILVGVDGSAGSEQALRLAFEEATIRNASVTAVRAYSLVPPAYAPVVPGMLEDPVERHEAEKAALAADVAPWAEKYPSIGISCLAIEGHPADVLTRRSGSAGLVVVGHRGHGALTGLLLGSVGLHLLHHADCPVLIARTSDR